jgi:hypothetical protein
MAKTPNKTKKTTKQGTTWKAAVTTGRVVTVPIPSIEECLSQAEQTYNSLFEGGLLGADEIAHLHIARAQVFAAEGNSQLALAELNKAVPVVEGPLHDFGPEIGKQFADTLMQIALVQALLARKSGCN